MFPMPNMSPRDLITQLMQRNPNIANNPQAKSYIDTVMGGNQEQIKNLAMNICNSYGITPEQARNDTMRFFGFH